MPRLDKLRLTGSGSIDADSVDGDAIEAAVTGSGDLKFATLTGKDAEIEVSGSGDIEIGGGNIASGDIIDTGSGDEIGRATCRERECKAVSFSMVGAYINNINMHKRT